MEISMSGWVAIFMKAALAQPSDRRNLIEAQRCPTACPSHLVPRAHLRLRRPQLLLLHTALSTCRGRNRVRLGGPWRKTGTCLDGM
jgi:hypothetical protein